jgi:hypothetical protein
MGLNPQQLHDLSQYRAPPAIQLRESLKQEDLARLIVALRQGYGGKRTIRILFRGKEMTMTGLKSTEVPEEFLPETVLCA